MAALLCLQNRTGGSPPMGGGFFNQHNGDFCISRDKPLQNSMHGKVLKGHDCTTWLKPIRAVGRGFIPGTTKIESTGLQPLQNSMQGKVSKGHDCTTWQKPIRAVGRGFIPGTTSIESTGLQPLQSSMHGKVLKGHDCTTWQKTHKCGRPGIHPRYNVNRIDCALATATVPTK